MSMELKGLWLIRLCTRWTDPETLCRLSAAARGLHKEGGSDEHWTNLASSLVVRPLADTELLPFTELFPTTGLVEDAMKTKVLMVYFPLFQARRRIRQLWKSIEALWQEMLPEALESLLPGVGEKELEEVEDALGCQLPEDLAESLRVHEGMRESGGRKGQFLFELKSDRYTFSTVRLRPICGIPDLVEKERCNAAAFEGHFRDELLRCIREGMELTSIAYVELEQKYWTTNSWLPLFATLFARDDRFLARQQSENILFPFPPGRTSMLQAVDQLGRLPNPKERVRARRTAVDRVRVFQAKPDPGTVHHLVIHGFCGPEYLHHCSSFEEWLEENLGMLQIIQRAWSEDCLDCSKEWQGWHCKTCQRIVGESLADALDRVLPVDHSCVFDRYSWWAFAMRSHGWGETFVCRRQG